MKKLVIKDQGKEFSTIQSKENLGMLSEIDLKMKIKNKRVRIESNIKFKLKCL